MHQEYIFRCRGSHRAPAESWQESMTTGKEYTGSGKTHYDGGKKGKRRGE